MKDTEAEPGDRLPYLLLRVAAEPVESLDGLAAPDSVRLLDRRAVLLAEIDTCAKALNRALFEAAGPPDPDAGPEAAGARLAVVAVKRTVFNRRRIDPASLETAAPRLSSELRERLEAQDARLANVKALGADFEDAFARELVAGRRALLSAARDPDVQAALRLSSRALVADLRRLPEPELWRHDERHVAATLAAYRVRSATKTSPHGLFCATAPACWATGDRPAGVQGENRLRLDVLLHVVEARKVAACLGSGPDAWPVLVPRVNPTLVEENDAWILWRPASLADDDNREILRRIARHPVAELFVDKAREGGRSVADLVAEVAEETGLPEPELATFFDRLADAGLLSREIEIPYTCRRPLAYLADRFRAHERADGGAASGWLPKVEAIETGVDELATLPPEERTDRMDRLTERLDALPHRRSLHKDELFRVDAASEISVVLPPDILPDLRSTLSRWARLLASIHPRRMLRRSFARRFVEEHGPDREVALLEVYRRYEGASRAESGKDPRLSFPPPPSGDSRLAREGREAYERARGFFARRAREAAATGAEEVRLSNGDWERLLGDTPEPRWVAGAVVQVAASEARELDAGRYRVAINDLFTGLGLALARFATLHHGADPGPNPIIEELKQGAERFRPPGAVLAEITYNHWGRAANAGLRIPFLDDEIELPGERTSPGATPIPLTELTLRWDSAEDRLVLVWHRETRQPHTEPVEVVPVISSGVSPEGIVALLVGVGRQGVHPLSYFPGFDGPATDDPTEANGEPVTIRWPRFVDGRVVLFRRRWIFPPGTYPAPPTEDLDPDRLLERFFADVHGWRRHEGLPRHVFVCTERNAKPFAVDFHSPPAVDLLRRLVTPRPDFPSLPAPTLHVTEMLPGPDEMWVRDRRGSYASEFLVQMEGGRNG